MCGGVEDVECTRIVNTPSSGRYNTGCVGREKGIDKFRQDEVCGVDYASTFNPDVKGFVRRPLSTPTRLHDRHAGQRQIQQGAALWRLPKASPPMEDERKMWG
eukprot:COSAG04_NODE_14824_length_553_cov_12.484581_1_plen_102_part_10